MDMKDQGEINVLQMADQEVITIKTDGNKDTHNPFL
jgi:hypothetical protein